MPQRSISMSPTTDGDREGTAQHSIIRYPPR
jgi:hypothetical protein